MLLLRGGVMEDKSYISFKCTICGMIFIIPEDGLRKAKLLGRFISCPLGHRPIEELDRYDDLLECMEDARTYKRVKGRIKQVK